MSPLSCCFKISLMVAVLLLACGEQQKTSSERPAAGAKTVLQDLPAEIDPQARFLFYLHGQIVEDKGVRPEHPQFGVYEYEAIRDTLSSRGLTVISEARQAGTDVWKYAEKTTGQIEKLLAAGVPARHITVAGHSKGGAITMLTSSLLNNDRVNFVLMACCGDWVVDNPHLDLKGHILSIYEASDEWTGSCRRAFEKATQPLVAEEIEIQTGLGHGAFYRPMPEWVNPLVAWAEGETLSKTGD